MFHPKIITVLKGGGGILTDERILRYTRMTRSSDVGFEKLIKTRAPSCRTIRPAGLD